jgi:cyanophycinase
VIVVDSRDLASSNVTEIGTGEPVAIEHVIMHALISGHGYDIDRRCYLAPDALSTCLGNRN